MKTKSLFLFSLILLTFSSCIKDENQITEPDIPVVSNSVLYSGQNASVDLSVRVLDENNQALESALVIFGNEQKLTDEYGIAQFFGVNADDKRAHVDAELSGYFRANRNFNPTDGLNYVNFKMIPRTMIGGFSTSSGGVLSLNNGATLNFAAGSMVTEDGSLFEGDVNVFAAYIDPLTTDMAQIVPGDLMGVNGIEVMGLETYGMMGVELESGSGQALNLGDGNEAVLTFPIPSELQGSADPEIDLWFYNEENDVWEAEGTAELIGSNYVASVSHFTWYNCDYGGPIVDIEFTLLHGEAGLPLANTQVQICFNGMVRSGYTNSNGFIEGAVPQDELLTMKLIDVCGNPYYEEEIGPFSSNTDLGDIFVPSLDIGYPITGMAIDCDGNPVESGYVVLQETGSNINLTISLNSDGSFAYTSLCNTNPVNYSLLVADTDDLIISDPVTFVYDNSAINDLGDIVVCGQVLQEYFTMNLNGTEYNQFSQFNIWNPGDCWHLSSSFASNTSPPINYDNVTSISFQDIGMAGIASECSLDSTGFVQLLNTNTGIYNFLNLTSVTADVTNYPAGFGEYIQGTYSADHNGDPQNSIPPGTITGTFSILND